MKINKEQKKINKVEREKHYQQIRELNKKQETINSNKSKGF